jgi:hypothetical protein
VIRLFFETIHVPLEGGVGSLTVIRLKGLVSFLQQDGKWSKLHAAIIDTGAHTSVLPEKIWKVAERKVILDYELRGINPRPEYAIPAQLAEITCTLYDSSGNHSDDLLMPSLLAQSNEVPLILGFAGLLSKFEVRFDYQVESAYLLPTSMGLHEIAR